MKALLWCSLLVLTAGQVGAQTPASVQGKVVSWLMNQLLVRTAEGQDRVVAVPATVPVLERTLVPWTNIRPGDWVGVDSKPGSDGVQESVVITVFSPSMAAKVRKGHFPMASGDLMTNASVSQVDPATGSLALADGDSMVPFRITKTTVVHRLTDGQSALLKVGATVSARGVSNPDGSVLAASITVEGP